MPKDPDKDDYPDVKIYLASSDIAILGTGQEIMNKMQELIDICEEAKYKFLWGILSDTVKKSKNLMEFYLTWELRVDSKTNVKSYFNRHTQKLQLDYPLPKGWIKVKDAENYWQKGTKYVNKPPSHFTTSGEVQFLLRIAEVNDAQDKLHAMRLLLKGGT